MKRSVLGLHRLAIAALTTFSMTGTAIGAIAPALALETVEPNQLFSADNSPSSSSAVLKASSAQTLPLRVVLGLSERRVNVYRGEMLVSSYEVAVGREGWSTPVGEFSIFQKQTDPAWEHPFTGVVVPPGPDNPLGSRWIGFWSDGVNSIGFHGTPDESLIGSAVSHGCVRMRNEDVLALYEQVELDTPVIVVP